MSVLFLATHSYSPYRFGNYYFVDLENKNIEVLKKRCQVSTVPNELISYLVGDANKKVDEITANISKFDKEFIRGILPCLNLAFLDPEGLELEWETVEALAHMKRMDLIIHYSQK